MTFTAAPPTVTLDYAHGRVSGIPYRATTRGPIPGHRDGLPFAVVVGGTRFVGQTVVIDSARDVDGEPRWCVCGMDERGRFVGRYNFRDDDLRHVPGVRLVPDLDTDSWKELWFAGHRDALDPRSMPMREAYAAVLDRLAGDAGGIRLADA